MISSNNFKEKHPGKFLGFFAESDLKQLEGKLPDDAIAFLKEEGRSVFGDGFLRTVLPGDYQHMLYGWGLEALNIRPQECYVLMRTSLGALIYFFAGTYYALNPILGANSNLDTEIFYLLNFQLSLDIILEESFLIDIHRAGRKILPDLQEDEMYALAPAVPLGGSPRDSAVAIVKMSEHLSLLSELYGHAVTDD